MAVVDLEGGVELDAVEEAFPLDVRSDVVEDEIAVDIGHEMHAGVTRERGELSVDGVAVGLQRDDIVIVFVVLALVD